MFHLHLKPDWKMDFKPVFLNVCVPRKTKMMDEKANLLNGIVGCFYVDCIVLLLFQRMKFNQGNNFVLPATIIDYLD